MKKLLFLALIATSCSTAAKFTANNQPSHQQPFKAVGIGAFDGDSPTINVNDSTFHIRLYGIDAQNIQVKLVSNPKGFNQIDKRWVDTYKNMWNIPDNVTTTLKRYTGQIEPNITSPRDERRMFADELDWNDLHELLNWFRNNKFLIVSDIMKGRGKLAAEWIMVVLKFNDEIKWHLEPMNIAMNYFSQGDVTITSQGNIKMGRITVQRKGGDGGKDTAKMLQFKLNPCELFS